MVTITWQDGANAPEKVTIPDAVLASLERFRNGPCMQTAKGGPAHATVKDMLIGSLMEIVIKPALHQFPTPEIVDLAAKADAAQVALKKAHAAAIVRGSIDANM